VCAWFTLTRYHLFRAAQIIIANMSDPDDLRRYHFSDYLESVRPRTAQGKFEEATRSVAVCNVR
jgi:hypothetical protein